MDIQIKYYGEIKRYEDFLINNQMKDAKFWDVLVKQFINHTDSKDEGWRGEFWGKIMRGATMIYQTTADEELYAILTKTVNDLLHTEDEYGRISSYSVSVEYRGWDIWGRKYVMLGMLFYYGICKDKALKKRIVKCLTKQANILMENVGKNGKKFSETSNCWGAVNSYSVLQPIVRLYKITGEKKLLSYAEEMIYEQSINGENLFKIADENRLAPYEYPIVKAYEVVSCFEGLLDYYTVTGKEDILQICIKFAKRLLKTDYTIVGGSGCYDEFFDNSTKKQVEPTAIHMQETCVTVTVMKFLSELYSITDDEEYLNKIENSFYNAYLGVFRNKNLKFKRELIYSYSPLIAQPRWELMGGKKTFDNGDYCGCCVAICGAGFGALSKAGCRVLENGVEINYFVEGKYRAQISGKEVMFSISGSYPYSGKNIIEFENDVDNCIIKIRNPYWAKTTCKTSADVVKSEENQYVKYVGRFKKGEKIEIEIQEILTVLRSEKFNKEAISRFAVKSGLHVLCLDERMEDVEKEYGVCDFEDYTICEEDLHKYEFFGKTGEKVVLVPYSEAGTENTKLTAWIKEKN